MQCLNSQTSKPMDTTVTTMETMCSMTSSNTPILFQPADPLSSNPAGTVVDPATLSFMSKLFPEMPTLYSQAMSKEATSNQSGQPSTNGPPVTTDGDKGMGNFHTLTADSLIPTSLLPFGPFTFQPGMGNLAFVPNPIVSGGDPVSLLTESRNPSNLLTTVPNSLPTETLKTSSSSPLLLASTLLNNDPGLNQLNSTNSSQHVSKKLGVSSMTEIANLLQLSNMNSAPYSNYNTAESPTKSRPGSFPCNQNLIQTGKTDEDFCELCQKHFCNKYYLRKHKADVHGIHTEPYSHSRRRESLSTNVQKHCTTPQLSMPSIDRAVIQSSVALSLTSSTQKVTGSNKMNYPTETDQFSTESGAAAATTTGSFPSTTEGLATENGTIANLPYPPLPIGVNPMDYTSVLKETFMLNALHSKLPVSSTNPTTECLVPPNFPPASNTNNLPVPINGMDSMLSAHYYMIALMSSLSPGVAHEVANSVENTPPQMDKHSMNDIFPNLSNLETNTGIREVQCDQCHKVFCNQYFLQVHKANQHNPANDSAHDVTFSTGSVEQKDDVASSGQRPDLANDYVKMRELELQSYMTNQAIRTQGSVDRLQTGGSIMHSENPNNKSDAKANSNSLDVFKSSMVAAKLADRVTCEFCKKELCNKYFLRTHKIRVHGVSPKDVGGPPMRNPPVVTSASTHHQQQLSTSMAAVTHHHGSNLSYPGLDSSNHARFPTGSNMNNPGLIVNGISRTGSGTNSSSTSTSITSESLSGMFGPLPIGLPSPHLANPLFSLPYWSVLSQSIAEQNTNNATTSITPTTSNLSSPTTATATANSTQTSTLEAVVTAAVTAIPPPPPPQIANTIPGEAPTLLPLGLNGSDSLSATAVISCPICEQIIGPRLFLPSHLTTVHGLNPLDPAFFLNMLRAKSITAVSETDKPGSTGGEVDAQQMETRTAEQSELHNCIDVNMPTLVQEEMSQVLSTGNGPSSSNAPGLVTCSSVRSGPEPSDGGQVSPKQMIRSSSCDTATTTAVRNTTPSSANVTQENDSMDASDESKRKDEQPVMNNATGSVIFSAASNLNSNTNAMDISAGIPHSPIACTATITTTNAGPLPLTEPATSYTLLPYTSGLSSTPGISSFPNQSNASMAAAAVAAAAAISKFPINPIEAVVAAMAAASGSQWNPSGQQPNTQPGLTPLMYQGPPSAAILSASSASPILGAVAQNATGGLVPTTTSGMPRKSPNQMRVLCDICNKWICNKYFLRTHRANKHGITDTNSSTSSLDGYKSNHAKLAGCRSQSGFRKALASSSEDPHGQHSPDTVESNSQDPNAIRLIDQTRSPKTTVPNAMDTGSDGDKLDSQEKFLQAWKMAYEAGPQANRDVFGPTYPFPPMPGQIPPFITPAMLLSGFPASTTTNANAFNSNIGPNSILQSPFNYMLPMPPGLESPINMNKSPEFDSRRLLNGPVPSEPDESSEMLIKSMIQSDSPVNEKHTDMKVHLPLNLSLKPSSTPLKKRQMRAVSDELITRSSYSANRSKRYLILGHLRRAKRFCLHSVWRKQQNQMRKEMAKFSSIVTRDQSEKTSLVKDGNKETTHSLNAKLTQPVAGTLSYSTHIQQPTENGCHSAVMDTQDVMEFDTILTCPLCPTLNAIKFTTLNPLLQHISLVHGNPTSSTGSNNTNDCPFGLTKINSPTSMFPTSHTNQTSPVQSGPFQVQQLASNDLANQDPKSHDFLNPDTKIGQPAEAPALLPTSVCVSEPPTASNSTHLKSIPVSATLHRPVFIPMNSYTETLSTM